MSIQFKRGTTAQHATYVGAVGELTFDTDKKVPVLHDGITPGGWPQLGLLEADARYAALLAGNLSGIVAYFAMSTAPSGWLKANGALISRTTYASLFTAIGTTFGVGNGITTFALPDLRGEFIRNWDDARGVDTGRVFGSAQAQDIQPHTHVHSVMTDNSTQGANIRGTSSTAVQGASATGSTGGTETRPRNIALLACIKY